MAGLTEKLAAFSASLACDRLPEKVVSQAQRCLLDTTGALLAGSRLSRSGQSGRKFAERLGEKEEAVVAGSSLRRAPMTAAFVNGMAAHALELDDGSK